LSLKPRINKTCRGVNDDGKTANATPPLDARDQIGGNTNALKRCSQREFSWLENERISWGYRNRFSVLVDGSGVMWVHTRNMRKPITHERIAESQVNACWLNLDLRVIEWSDNKLTAGQAKTQVLIGQYHCFSL
jgi:hypothetical protein